MPPSRTCWSIACTAASRRSCCSMPTATDSSTCSIAPAARCCWRSRSCGASTGRRGSGRTDGRSSRIRAAVPAMRRTGPRPRSRRETGLYYFLALEECIGKPTGYPDQTGQRFLRAVNIETGEIAWEVPQPGAGAREDLERRAGDGGRAAVLRSAERRIRRRRSARRRTLWQFPTNVRMKASPMTFSVGGRQYVAVAAGPTFSASVSESHPATQHASKKFAFDEMEAWLPTPLL